MRRGAAALARCGLCLTLLSACATGPTREPQPAIPGIQVEGFVIRNELPYTLNNLMIEVPATGAFAGCGTIPPRSECSNTFEHVDYRGHAAVISWTEHGEPQTTDEFVVDLPDGVMPGDVFVLEIVVFAPGRAGARLRERGSGGLRNR